MGTFTELIHVHCSHPNWTIGARGACTCCVPQLYELSPWGGKGEACWASQITSYLCASPAGGQNENRKSYTCQHCKYLASAQHPVPHPSASPVDLSAKTSTLQGEPPYMMVTHLSSPAFVGVWTLTNPADPPSTALCLCFPSWQGNQMAASNLQNGVGWAQHQSACLVCMQLWVP